jgi:hypothetical protein
MWPWSTRADDPKRLPLRDLRAVGTQVPKASAEAGVEWAVSSLPSPPKPRETRTPRSHDGFIHRRITWRVVVLGLLVWAAIIYGFQVADSQISREYPAPKTIPTYNPPTPTTPAEFLQEGYITPAEYQQEIHGQVLRNDPNCEAGIDTSSAHAGDLCLP